jgi:phosphatidylglycerophosphatase A
MSNSLIRKKSFRFLIYVVATTFGAGFSPIAPGTAGSLIAVLLIYFLSPVPAWILIIALIILFFAGVFTGTQLEKEKGHDPSLVVIDEFVGMGISLLFLDKDWRFFLIAFILFRFFDIVKPPPINLSQKLAGGYGIMIDDVLAGLYALILTHLVVYIIF